MGRYGRFQPKDYDAGAESAVKPVDGVKAEGKSLLSGPENTKGKKAAE